MEMMMTETLLRWRLNGQPQEAILCSPSQEEALLLGRLITGRQITDPAQLRGIARREGEWLVEAEADAPRGLTERLAELPLCVSPCKAALSQVLRDMERLRGVDHASGLHTAMIFAGGQAVTGRDIGRHNALDKAVGAALAQGLPLREAVLCLSGRLSVEMLSKTAGAGIPIVCTRKQVGDLACREAQRLGIAVVQALEPVSVYGAAYRILMDQEGKGH